MAEPAVARALDPEVQAIGHQVARIVRRVLPDPAYRVVLFGSWVSGTAAPRSDIDIGIDGPASIPAAAMFEIREQCDALATLRTVDVVDLRQVAASFREGLVTHPLDPS